MTHESKATSFASGIKVVVVEILTLLLLFVLQQWFTR